MLTGDVATQFLSEARVTTPVTKDVVPSKYYWQGLAAEVTGAQSEFNSYAERVRSVKEEYWSRLILIGENSLRRALTQYIEHYHRERNHQGKDNELLFPLPRGPARRRPQGAIRCRERLGGLLKYYERRAS